MGNYRDVAPDSTAVERLRQLAGRWRLLVVAEDWCSDSVNTLPYVARLADAGSLPRDPDHWPWLGAGRAVMESHPTPDGQATTPTMIVLDEDGREAGCFIERPAALRRGSRKAAAETRRSGIARTAAVPRWPPARPTGSRVSAGGSRDGLAW
ncbi:MAG: thioredoxin family protein [Gemmatimonadales bacterium]